MSKNDQLTYLELIYYGLDCTTGIKYSGYNKGAEKNADREIKVCTKCEKVYEIHGIGKGNYDQLNYENFPKLGKKKEKCGICRVSDGQTTFIAWHRGSSTNISVSRFRPGYKKTNVRIKKKTKRP